MIYWFDNNNQHNHHFDSSWLFCPHDVTLSAEQPEAAGSPGPCGEQVRVHPHLHPEDEQPAAAGPEQQPAEGPAAGYGQVTDDIITTTCHDY